MGETKEMTRENEPQRLDALPPSVRFVTLQQLVKAGHARTSIWRSVKCGELPKPIKFLGKLGWRESTLKRSLKEAEEKA